MPRLETPGRHAAKATAAEFGQSEKGTPFIQISFETVEGSITGWLYLSEKALPGSLRTLRQAFGFDGNFETAADQIVGKDCSIVCEVENFEGADRLKVKWINSPSSTVPLDNKDDFLKSLTAKAARIPKEAPKAGHAPTKAAPAPKVQPKTNQQGTDEIDPDNPF